MRARKMSAMLWLISAGWRGSVMTDASLVAMPRELSTAASSMTPPSEVMRPPSNAAVIFLRCTDGSENGSRVSSVMAGVAASDSAGLGLDTQISATDQTLMLHPPTNP